MVERSAGSVIAGYRIDEIIGRGGMGVVYRATDVVLERSVALKLVAPELAQDPSFRARFARELKYVASIDHPNVIPVHHAGEDDGVLFIAMRYVLGTDLRAMIGHEGALDPERAVRIVGQVAEALDAAHERGVVHRDVKPANVLVEDRDGVDHVYLTDFGLSKHTTSAPGLTATGHFVGTVDYVAPEQIRGETVNERADVYALGCVLFHALTGQAPYARDSEAAKLWAHMYEPPPSVQEVHAGAPAAFDAVIRRAMDKQLESRYGSAGELGRAALAALRPPGETIPGGLFRPPGPDSQDTAVSGILGPPMPAPPVAGPAPPAGAASPPARPPARGTDPMAPAPASAGWGDDVASPQPHPSPSPARERPATRSKRVPVVVAGVALAAVAAAAALLLGPGSGSGADAKVVATIPVGKGPSDVAVAGNVAWVSNYDDGTLTRIDAGGRRGRRIRVGDNPLAVAVGEGTLWVADAFHRLDRLDPKTGRRRSAVRQLTGDPEDIAVGGGGVWLPNGLGDSVTRLDARTGNVSQGSIPVGQAPVKVAVAGDSAWVVSEGSKTVTRLDAGTARQIGSPVRVGSSPSGVAVGAGSVWVANTGSNTVTRIDAKSGKVRGRPIEVGRGPSAVAVGLGHVWVTNADDDSVTRIDVKSGEPVGEPIAVGKSPSAVSVGAGSVWVVNNGSDNVSRIES
ncbi:MAG: hypothetical protein QOC64_3726 [Solirubrobacteraceae bacterium]|nr:hypothetical protein [Solirubrobacteraceae bacterium]